jgi:hypothetical protein
MHARRAVDLPSLAIFTNVESFYSLLFFFKKKLLLPALKAFFLAEIDICPITNLYH